jgi:DNA repair protein RadC
MIQEDSQEQLRFFQDTMPTATPKKEKCAAIPIYRVSLVRESRLHSYHKQIRSSADAGALVHAYLEGVDREHFVVLMLDQKNKVIGINTVSVGSLTASVVHPREVFKPAILSNAAAIILAHNHPSGAPQPSQEDRVLTVRLVTAGKLLGISILDHVIIGDGTSAYFSFADEGLLP